MKPIETLIRYLLTIDKLRNKPALVFVDKRRWTIEKFWNRPHLKFADTQRQAFCS